jgi:hypothetical protein
MAQLGSELPVVAVQTLWYSKGWSRAPQLRPGRIGQRGIFRPFVRACKGLELTRDHNVISSLSRLEVLVRMNFQETSVCKMNGASTAQHASGTESEWNLGAMESHGQTSEVGRIAGRN